MEPHEEHSEVAQGPEPTQAKRNRGPLEQPSLGQLRDRPFGAATTVVLIVSIAVLRLPDQLITEIRLGRPFSPSQTGAIFFILAVVAGAQALYVGLKVLRIEAIDEARSEASEAPSSVALVRTVSRETAWIPLLTLVYGLSDLAFTGERAGYWLFLLICLAQLGWYYRRTGVIADHLDQQMRLTIRGNSEEESG